MKTPKKKKNKKAKDTFKDIETIDLTTSPASSSAPASSPSTRLDGYSVPNSPTNAAAADKAAMPPPSRPGGKSTYQPQGPNADQSGAGTGAHDNHLARSRGNFRHKSLRRGSGMAVETPQAIKKERDKRKQQGTWPDNPSQAKAAPQPTSTTTTREPPVGPRANNNPYEFTRPQSRRGDLQNGYQRPTAPVRAAATSNSESLQGTAHVQSSQSTQRPAKAQAPSASSTSVKDPPVPGPSNAGSSMADHPPVADRPSVTDRPIPSPATTETPGNQTPRRNFSMACKVKVMELCLASKDIYLKMTPSPSFDQKPFWEHVLQGIESDPATRSLFKDWRDVRCYVDVWAQPRRSNLRENNLPAPSPGQPELDRAIDKWNLVFAQRFCVINQGYFESSIWTLAEEHIISIMQSEIQTWIAGALQKRMEELERYARPVLGYNRAPDDYNNPTRRLFYRSQAANPDDAMQVRETEGLISLVLDLQPRLRSAISEYIRNGESNGHGDNGQSSDGFQADDERQGSGHYEHTQHEVVPSIETPAPAPGYGRAPGYYSRNDRGISSSPRSGRSRGRSKKRKKPDQGQSTPSTNNLSIRTRVLPGYGDSTGSGPKRQRVNEAGPVWARDTSDNPFVTPQPRRRAHRPESPGRFREETAEFNNMTPDSKADMLFKAIKEIRREK